MQAEHLRCAKCFMYFHLECQNISVEQFKALRRNKDLDQWTCLNCQKINSGNLFNRLIKKLSKDSSKDEPDKTSADNLLTQSCDNGLDVSPAISTSLESPHTSTSASPNASKSDSCDKESYVPFDEANVDLRCASLNKCQPPSRLISNANSGSSQDVFQSTEDLKSAELLQAELTIGRLQDDITRLQSELHSLKAISQTYYEELVAVRSKASHDSALSSAAGIANSNISVCPTCAASVSMSAVQSIDDRLKKVEFLLLSRGLDSSSLLHSDASASAVFHKENPIRRPKRHRPRRRHASKSNRGNFFPPKQPSGGPDGPGSDPILSNVAVIGDSMVRHVSGPLASNGISTICRPGSRINQIADYLVGLPHAPADDVVIHVGTNDIRSSFSPYEIPRRLESLFHKVRARFPEIRLTFSGIVARRDIDFNFINTVNKNIKRLCDSLGCAFIDCNGIISDNELGRDGLHFNRRGSRLFSEFILNSFSIVKNA